ncbi:MULTISPECIES: Invasion protein B family [unclassified Pseudomonas]|uniref:InvB/SpaK family type III secretion system chaperone n=1 Tax=unclassified Pseudomonas TaxID=196821 RepID=UPI00385D47BE
MNYIDIAGLLSDALRLSGCTDEQIGSFDGHSTIELELVEMPAIKIGLVDDSVWFWSTLTEFSDMLMTHRSAELLRFLMQGFAFSRTEQLQLTNTEDMLEVRVLLADSALESAESLAQAVEDYLGALSALCEIINQ